MINGVWIIHQDGKCLFFREYQELDINEQLFSGFLVALLSFSKEISHQEIRSINLEELTLYYKTAEKIIFVVAADISDREIKIREKLDLIEETFFNEFSDVLTDWSGKIDDFKIFEAKLDEVLRKKGHQVRLFDISFISKASVENLMNKISHVFGIKNNKEINELDHTIGVIENFSNEIDRFNPPKFLIELPQKLKNAFKRLIHKEEK